MESNSANQQLLEMLIALLRGIAPAAGMAAPFLSNMILPRGSRYDVPLVGSGSPGGAFAAYGSGYMQSGAYMAMAGAQNTIRDHFYTGAANAIYGSGTEAAAMAQKWSANYATNMLYHMADPLQIQPAMTTAARTVSMGMRIHSANPFTDFTYGQRLTSMFADTQNGLLTTAAKNPRDFGGFGVNAVTQIAAEIQASGTDFVGNMNPGQLPEQTKKMVDKVKAVSKALIPLKDMFGEDIPRMMQMLESMAGRNIAGDAKQIESLSYKLSSTLQATGATAAQYAATLPIFNQATVDPLGQSRAVLGAGRLGMDYLASTANLSIPGVTSNELQAMAAGHLVGTAKSVAVTTYQKAVALLQLQGKAKSVQEADAMMKANLAGTRGMDANEAALAAFNKSGGIGGSLNDLNQAQGSEALATAGSENIGHDVTTNKQFQVMQDRAVAALRKAGKTKEADELAALSTEQYIKGISENTDKSTVFSSRAAAYEINKVSVSAAKSVGVLGWNGEIKDLRALGGVVHNKMINERRAEQAEKLSKAVDKIGTTSGMAGVISVLTGKGGATLVDAVSGLFGKLDLSEAMSNWDKESKTARQEAGDNLQYAMQNAITLTPYQIEQVQLMMNSKDASVRRGASGKLTATRDMAGYLARITDKKKQTEAVEAYAAAKLAGGDKFNSKDWIQDREYGEAAAKVAPEKKRYAKLVLEATAADKTGLEKNIQEKVIELAKAQKLDVDQATSMFKELREGTSMARGQMSWLEDLLTKMSGFLDTLANGPKK